MFCFSFQNNIKVKLCWTDIEFETNRDFKMILSLYYVKGQSILNKYKAEKSCFSFKAYRNFKQMSG